MRRQSPIEPNGAEPQILDHVTQQAKILPQVARGVCYRLAADGLWTFYQRVMQQIAQASVVESKRGSRELPELHALSCCLKSVCTHDAAQGIDVLRKACGGHGYLASSNFDSIQGLANAAVTYEGEYTVLLLQTARFLLRQYVDGQKRRVLPSSVRYLRNTAALRWGPNLLENVARALEISTTAEVRQAWQQKEKKTRRDGHSEQQASNLVGRRLTAAASLHGHTFLVRNAIDQLAQLQRTGAINAKLGALLQQLVELFALDTFLRELGALLKWNNISARQMEQVEQRYEQLLQQLRPNAVALVDGFDFHDRVLGSTLGSYDGRIYERLMEHARSNPLNQEPVNPSYRQHLQPLLRGKL